MTNPGSFDDDTSVKVTSTLKSRLEDIAGAHDGGVRLHGRLFAQWLHYVFPRECAFPHKAGTVSALTRASLDVAKASMEEMLSHAMVLNESLHVSPEGSEVEWMSQWSAEEELIVGYMQESPGGRGWIRIGGCLLFLVVGLRWTRSRIGGTSGSWTEPSALGLRWSHSRIGGTSQSQTEPSALGKSHYV